MDSGLVTLIVGIASPVAIIVIAVYAEVQRRKAKKVDQSLPPAAGYSEVWAETRALRLEMYGDGTPEHVGMVHQLADAVTQSAAAQKIAANADRRADAAVHVVRDLIRQWGTRPVPLLNPADLDVLDEDTLPLPPEWRRKP